MNNIVHKLKFCAGLLYLLFSGTSFPQTFLSPNDFTSLGTFNSTGNITVDMNSNQMTGGFTGVISGGVLIFTFDSFTLNAGHTITFTNVTNLDNPVAFLSKGNMTISGTINANAGTTNETPGPGGGFGGNSGTGLNGTGGVGSGPGHGTGTDGGAGAGFGGSGGNSFYTAQGGPTYNANFSDGITGGSGGTGSDFGDDPGNIDSHNDGGAGAGGIELGGLGTLTINSSGVITAIGGSGISTASSGSDGGGGGSGGGIFIHSFNIVLASGSTLNVSGGSGGAVVGGQQGSSGAGGGGGRIYIAAHTSGTLTNSGANIVVTGGAAGVDGDNTQNSQPGGNGTSTITQVDNPALPVELISFAANVKGKVISLTWQTATEVNNYGFEIERLQNLPTGQAGWEKIGFVQGSGNSNSVKNYSFRDDLNLKSGSYSYRLKQIDYDGQFEYSNTVEFLFTAPTEFSLKQNYPNPFNPVTNISYSLAEKSQVSLTIYDVLGREIVNLVNKEQESGVYNVQFDAGNLNSGIYFYQIQAGNFSEVKKLMLVK